MPRLSSRPQSMSHPLRGEWQGYFRHFAFARRWAATSDPKLCRCTAQFLCATHCRTAAGCSLKALSELQARAQAKFAFANNASRKLKDSTAPTLRNHARKPPAPSGTSSRPSTATYPFRKPSQQSVRKYFKLARRLGGRPARFLKVAPARAARNGSVRRAPREVHFSGRTNATAYR